MKFFEEFRSVLGSIAGSMQKGSVKGGDGGAAPEETLGLSEKDIQLLKDTAQGIDDLNEELTKLNKQIKEAKAEDKFKLEEKRLQIQQELTEDTSKLNDLNKTTDQFMQKQIVNEQNKTKLAGKGFGDLSNVSGEYNDKIKQLFETQKAGGIGMGDFSSKLKGLKFESKALQGFSSMMGSSSTMFSNIGGMAAKGIGGGLMKVLPPQFQIIARVIVAIVGAAFEQINKLNKIMIDTLRQTGGVVNSAMMGFDNMGNSLEGYASLETQAIKANISAEQFGTAINKLFDKVPGQVAGLKDNLKTSGEAMQQYGMEAAKLQKFYGADMSGAVGNLMMNFGMGMKDSTKLAKDTADSARAAGLSVKETMKNLEAATALAGKFYMATTEQLTKLTFMATKLGVSVDSLAAGTLKMNGLVGLFQQQQKMAALEMTHLASAAAKIYALRAQGKGGEAAQVEMAAMAKDMQSKGMIDKKSGQVSQQGIATMQAAGATQETINAISRMGRVAKETGISLEKMTDPAKLTKSEKAKLDLAERNNRTLEEQLKMTFGGLKQALIDPIAKMIGSILKPILGIVEVIIGVISAVLEVVFQALDPIISIIGSIFEEVGAIFQDVFGPMKEMFNNIVGAIQPIINMLKNVFGAIISVVAVPFRIIGKILGSVFSVIGRIIKVIGEKLKPIFDFIGNIFKGIKDFIGGLLDWIDSVLGWIVDIIGGIIGFIFDIIGVVFDVIGTILGYIWDVLSAIWDFLVMIFQPVVDFLKWIWDGIMSLVDFFTSDEDNKAAGTELTPEMIDALYGKALNGPVDNSQNVNATEKKEYNDYKIREADKQAVETEKLMTAAVENKTETSKEASKNAVTNVNVSGIVPSKTSLQKRI
jgi:phage-related protein